MTSKQNEFVTSGTLRAKNRLRTWRWPDGAMPLRDRTFANVAGLQGAGLGASHCPHPLQDPWQKALGGRPTPTRDRVPSRVPTSWTGSSWAPLVWPLSPLCRVGLFRCLQQACKSRGAREEQGCWGWPLWFGLEVSSFWKPCGGGASQGADLGFHPDSTTPPLTDRA